MKRINAIFNNPRNKYFAVVNDVLALLTLISIAGIVLETVPALEKYSAIFLGVELVTVAFFALEYVLRLAAAPSKRGYIFSFFGLIDLISILPTLIGLANLTFLKSARVLRILRLLRMVRLAKVARLRHHKQDAEHSTSIYRLNLEIYFAVLLSSIVVLGSLIYVIEAPRQGFTSIPEGMMWSAEMILGGSIIGNLPQTIPGQVLGLITRFVGLTLLGMLIYVVGHFLRSWLLGDKSTKD